MADTPRGVIPRVQAQRSHSAFLDAVSPDTAMLNLIEARKLSKRGETAASYFGAGTDVIVTSTVPDRDLDLLSWERELDIVRDVAPDFHIPTDYPTYGNMDVEQRRENVRECMTGTIWMGERLVDTETTLIPLVKGVTAQEREICYRAADDLEADPAIDVTAGYRAYYATQYFSAGQGNRIGALVEDVTAIAEECGGNVLLIGLLSPTYLRRMPSSVVAAAGMNTWRTAVTPRKQTAGEMRSAFATLVEDVEAAVDLDEQSPTARSGNSGG